MTPEPNRLLVVDDDPYNLDMLARRLARRGYTVDVAENGQSALEKISRAQYDLVLLDQMMPGMSGVELLRLLRVTYSQSDLPVIMVTALDQSQMVVQALDRGANDYVVKPVDLPALTARIETQLSRSKMDRWRKTLDPLTGLGNRMLLMERLAGAMARQSGGGPATLAVLLLDLDDFKNVNDSRGPSAGDQLLIEVTTRLRSLVAQRSLSPAATIARTGGDEFAIVAEGLDSHRQLPELADAILSCICGPAPIQGLPSITASIGVVVFGAVQATPEELLRDAELAMYRAKELGKNRWEMFNPGAR